MFGRGRREQDVPVPSLRSFDFPRLFFWINTAIAVGLVGMVVLAPSIAPRMARLGTNHTAVQLFADDAAMRRTAIGSAIGLFVSAFVFFRGPSSRRNSWAADTKPPPRNVIGA